MAWRPSAGPNSSSSCSSSGSSRRPAPGRNRPTGCASPRRRPTRESTSADRAGQPIRCTRPRARARETKTWSKPRPLTWLERHAGTAPGAAVLGTPAGSPPAWATVLQVAEKSRTSRALPPRPGARQLGEPRELEQALRDWGSAANRRWRRRPTFSIRRRTKTSARRSSIAAAAACRCAGRRWIRSRASGWNRGHRALLRRPRPCPAAAAGDRRRPRQVAGAQLDRRPGQCPRRRRRVVETGEDAQPGDRVAHLGALEERPARPRWKGCRAPPSPPRPGRRSAATSATTAQIPSGVGAGGDQVLDLAGQRLRLGALVAAAPEARPARGSDGRGRATSPPGWRSRNQPASSPSGLERVEVIVVAR